jgi:small-conductance mechanosensitive channel
MSTSEFAEREALTSKAHEIPESEYARRLSERQRQLASIRVLHQRLWTYVIAAALAGIVVVWAALSSPLISALWILLPTVVVLSSIRSLTKNAGIHSRVKRIASFYELGVARLHHQWQGRGIGGKEYLPESHAYASDLDLLGTGSLYELLCTARTGIGRVMLAKWLLNPAGSDEVRARQAAVAELRDQLGLREDWASVEGSALDQAGASVVDWVDVPEIAFPFYTRAFAVALPICLLVVSLLAAIGVFGHSWLWAVAFVVGPEALLAAFLLKKTRLTAANLIQPSFELALLAPLLDRFETLHFQCPLLKSLQLQLTASSGVPSKQIRLLRLWARLLNLRQFEYFAVAASVILWGTNLAICIERWRQRHREGSVRWLDSLGQFEALLCLARYCYENPDHTFAVLKRGSSPLFHAEAMGHPLLDRQTCFRCDVRLDAVGTQVIMVSGSNMSGKSTLLRSVGLNAVLALAGAPVRADQLQISTLHIGCSISVQDSLLQARSRFQAEVERLKYILALSRTHSVLFLVDEMLGGTNSADRLFGARAVIEQLVASGAVGLVTTHDLALTEVGEALDGHAINVHFEERYENGEMRFDYRMRPGVLTRTNGLNVMAALGILPSSKEGLTDAATPNPSSTFD